MLMRSTTWMTARMASSLRMLLCLCTSVQLFAQSPHPEQRWIVTLQASAGACQQVVQDEAYSRLRYAGWIPSGAIGVSMRRGEIAHSFEIGYVAGTLAPDGLKSAAMQSSAWMAGYQLHWAPGSDEPGRRLYGQLGGGLRYHHMRRDYEGFINDKIRTDQWAVLDLSGEMRIPLAAGDQWGLRLAGGIGFAGLFRMGNKWPDYGAGRDDADLRVYGLVHRDGFSAFMHASLYYRFLHQHGLELGYRMEGTTLDQEPSWGVYAHGPVLAYSIRL